jgi:hypothetical protein
VKLEGRLTQPHRLRLPNPSLPIRHASPLPNVPSNHTGSHSASASLDPQDWPSFRAQGRADR